MGLRTKFNLVMIGAFLVSLGLATYLAQNIAIENAQRQMLQEANIIMRQATAVRS